MCLLKGQDWTSIAFSIIHNPLVSFLRHEEVVSVLGSGQFGRVHLLVDSPAQGAQVGSDAPINQSPCGVLVRGGAQ